MIIKINKQTNLKRITNLHCVDLPHSSFKYDAVDKIKWYLSVNQILVLKQSNYCALNVVLINTSKFNTTTRHRNVYFVEFIYYLFEQININAKWQQIFMRHTSCNLCKGWNNAWTCKPKQLVNFEGSFPNLWFTGLIHSAGNNFKRCIPTAVGDY